jgi:hypothetical protein
VTIIIMRKRTPQIVFGCLGLALLVALIWLFVGLGGGNGDEGRYRRLGRTARSYAWISSLERGLPRGVAGLFHLRELEMRYQDKCEADLNALIDSGYLYGACFTVTNLAANRKEIHNKIADALKGTGYWGASLNLGRSELTVYCRPQYVPQLRKALGQ